MKTCLKRSGTRVTVGLAVCASAGFASVALWFMVSGHPSSTRAQTDIDSDGDGMPDVYEEFVGLDPHWAGDADRDYDHDFLTNLQEYRMGTDPFAPDTDRDGWPDHKDSNPLSRAYIGWGQARFTFDDEYTYFAPAWCLGGFKTGGCWITNAPSCYLAPPAAGRGSLCIALARESLPADLVMEVDFLDVPGGWLSVSLLATNGHDVVTNVCGNLIGNTGQHLRQKVNLPVKSAGECGLVRLDCGGHVLVFESLLYVDQDGDGLDADQERFLGFSDVPQIVTAASRCDAGASTGGPQIERGGELPGARIVSDIKPSETACRTAKSQPATARTLYVSAREGNDAFDGLVAAPQAGGRGPKRTCAAALAAAQARDTIVVRAGEYAEKLNITDRAVTVLIEGTVDLTRRNAP